VPRTLPVYTGEVAWSRTKTAAAVVGTATVGGAAVVDGAFSNYTFSAITSDIKDCVITRGRADDQGAVAAGTMTLTLDDQAGRYNPQNSGSPLAPNVDVMRPIRLTAVHNAVSYGLFFGFIKRIDHDPHPSRQETVIEAVDAFEWLRLWSPELRLGPTTVGAVIGVCLDQAGLTDPAYRDLDAGRGVPGVALDGGQQDLLSLINDLLTVDLGAFFVDGDGKMTYQDATYRYGARAVDDTLTATLISGARPSVDVANVKNAWIVQRRGGAYQFANDPVGSQTHYYGPRRGTTVNSAYLLDDDQAANLAAFKVLLYKDPVAPVAGVALPNRDDTAIVKQLSRDLGDRVTVTEALGGTSTTGTIEGLTHRIWGGGKFHTVEYVIARNRFDVAVVGTSTVGGAHVVGY
jgi:hypothetical protein